MSTVHDVPQTGQTETGSRSSVSLLKKIVQLKKLRHRLVARRFVVVEPGSLFRGGYPETYPLKRLLKKHGIKTVLSMMNPKDRRSLAEREIVKAAGARYIAIPMPGTGAATVAQLHRAADLLADPSLRPLMFHCRAGVNRSGVVHAAWRIKYQKWALGEALHEVVKLGANIRKNPVIAERLSTFYQMIRSGRPLHNDVPVVAEAATGADELLAGIEGI